MEHNESHVQAEWIGARQTLNLPGVRIFSAIFGASFLLLAVIQIACSLRIESSSLRTEFLGLQSKLLLLGREGALIALVSIILALSGLGLNKAMKVKSRSCKLLFAFAGFFIYAGFFCYYFTEWYSLLAMGRFTGLEGLRLWFANPLQVAQHGAHFEPLAALGVPGVSIMLGFAALAAVLTAEKWPFAIRLAVIPDAVLLAVLSLVSLIVWPPDWSVRSDRTLKKQHGIVASKEDLYATLREYQTGPFLRMEGDLSSLLRQDAEDSVKSDLIVEYRRQINLDDYMKGIDTATLRKHNVLLVLVESLRPDQLTAYSSPRPVMDTVDSLAREGTVFTDVYTEASHSNYADICPLASHYPLRSRRYYLYPENAPYPRVLIYDILKAAGYRTAIISSQNENWGQMSNYLRTPGLDFFLHAETFTGPTYVPRADIGFASFIKGSKRAGKIDDRFTVEEAAKWIGDDTSKPFFIYMNLQNSHVPYEIPADFPRRYSSADLDFTIRFGQFPKNRVREVKDVYADSLSYVDAQLAKLIAALKERNLLDSTLIIITGDTGQAFYEHGFAGHANQVYDELMRVPLVMRIPGREPARIGVPAQHIDIPPTVLSALGFPVHPSFQGTDLMSTVDPSRPRFLLAQTPLAEQFSIVEGQWKLVYDARTEGVKLFDLSDDPRERKNRAKKKGDVTERLKARVLAWKRAQLDYYSDLGRQAKFYPPVYR